MNLQETAATGVALAVLGAGALPAVGLTAPVNKTVNYAVKLTLAANYVPPSGG